MNQFEMNEKLLNEFFQNYIEKTIANSDENLKNMCN